MQRIGVFVCWCGSNIAATVDVAAVAQTLAKEPGVVYAADYQYMCSEAGQNLMIQAISDHRLTGVVICSCSPRMHEATFRKAAARAGLNPYLVEIANIRSSAPGFTKIGKKRPKRPSYWAGDLQGAFERPVNRRGFPVTKRPGHRRRHCRNSNGVGYCRGRF